LFKEHGPKWDKISKIIERTPTNVKDKWKTMGGKNMALIKNEKWSLGSTLKLLKYITETSGI
jgi:hypothetical protein